MRQGIVVTAVLAVFVAVAMIFVGGSSLFAVPPSSSGATASAADPMPPAHRIAGGIARSNIASVRTADTLGLLQWFSSRAAGLDLGKGDDVQPGFAALAAHATTTPERVIAFGIGIPASAPDAAPDTTLVAAIQPYTVAAAPPQKASYTEDPVSHTAPQLVAEPERDQAAPAFADFERLAVAAGIGDLNAEYKLGVMYRDGKGVARDAAAAAYWLLAAAKGNNPLAQLAIGEMYDSGTGVVRDPAAAYMWLDLAASRSADTSDRGFASRERDRVAAGLSEAERGAARRLVRDRLSVM